MIDILRVPLSKFHSLLILIAYIKQYNPTPCVGV